MAGPVNIPSKRKGIFWLVAASLSTIALWVWWMVRRNGGGPEQGPGDADQD